MTLSEREQQTLAEIETGCRAEDPGFAARLDLLAARTRRARMVIIAQCTILVGSLVLVLGAGMARGPVSAGAVVVCYGLVMIIAGAIA